MPIPIHTVLKNIVLYSLFSNCNDSNQYSSYLTVLTVHLKLGMIACSVYILNWCVTCVRSSISGIDSHVLNEVSGVWRCRGRNVSTYSAYWTFRGELSYRTYLETCICQSRQEKCSFQERWEEKYFCWAQDDNVRCLLCSIIHKGTHKWNIKRHYDTVLHTLETRKVINEILRKKIFFIFFQDTFLKYEYIVFF